MFQPVVKHIKLGHVSLKTDMHINIWNRLQNSPTRSVIDPIK